MDNQAFSIELNPRYVAYARVHGRTPNEMMSHDMTQYPGGCMCGFILWMDEQKRAFKKARPECFIGDNVKDQKAWTAWLESQPVI